ncbi:MAG: exosortase/archaeosortase family protein [Candidatus Omnitrophica bacterium]|nr:exosortase/archaeosortase family protein [Candidatus Omnitrophota bacterium]
MQKKALNYIIWGLTAALYSPIIYQLYKGRWDMVDYTHAYFILPISLWLVWRNRGALLKIETVSIKIGTVPTRRFSEWMGLSLFLTGLLIFIFGWRQDYLSMSTISLIPTLFGLTIYLYGSAIAKALSFPILYLLLMVPPPLGILDNITLPMRYWISVFTAHILKMFHYPITQSGLMLSLGGHEIYMGAPCSGFRSLITMISLGLVYVYIIKGKAVKKAILLGSIVPLALLGNLLRVIGMCLVTFHFGENIGTKFHDISGFVIFFVLILGLMGIDSLLSRFEHE